MEIKVLGTGCAKCNKLFDTVNEVVSEQGWDAHVEKITDMKKITSAGIMLTPALMIDDEVKITGKVPSKEDLTKLLSKNT